MQIPAVLRTGATIAAGLLVMTVALPVQAGVADAGWRVGVSGLLGDYKLDSAIIDDNAPGFQLYGQYRFNRYFAVGGSFLNMGDFEQDDTFTGSTTTTPESIAQITLNGFTADLIAYAPLSSTNFQVFGKAGFYRLDQDLEIDGANSGTRSADGLTLGAGAEVAIAEQWGLRLDGNWYDFDDADFWTVGLGVNYQFGKPAK